MLNVQINYLCRYRGEKSGTALIDICYSYSWIFSAYKSDFSLPIAQSYNDCLPILLFSLTVNIFDCILRIASGHYRLNFVRRQYIELLRMRDHSKRLNNEFKQCTEQFFVRDNELSNSPMIIPHKLRL